jgi:hypothetical protein
MAQTPLQNKSVNVETDNKQRVRPSKLDLMIDFPIQVFHGDHLGGKS